MTISQDIEDFTKSLWKRPTNTRFAYITASKRFLEFITKRFAPRTPTMNDLYDNVIVDFELWLNEQIVKESSRGTYVAGVFRWLNNAILRQTIPDSFSIERCRALYKEGQSRGGYHSRPPQEFMDVPSVVFQFDTAGNEDSRKTNVNRLCALRDRALIWFIYTTGTRQGTARMLKRKQVVDPYGGLNKTITAVGKGNKTGTLVFEDNLARQYLSEYIAARNDTSEYLFVSHDKGGGTPLSGTTVWRIFHAKAKAMGFDYSPHDMRHFWAIDKINRGMALELVQTALWHASPTTTAQVYANVKTETLVTQVNLYPMPQPTEN